MNEAVFNEFPVIKTPRLTLRDIRLSDADKIFEMRSNGRVNQFISRNSMQHPEDSVALVERTRKAYADKLAIGWAGILRDGNEIIGTCGYNQIDFMNNRAEIGGELAVDFWGKHIAMEAVSAIISFGLNQMELHTIEAKVSPENRGAIFLLESLGFKKEAHFKDRIYFNQRYFDMAVYTLIKGQEQLLNTDFSGSSPV